ncbi:MAG: glycerol-3-phosphate dehydrogenase, partial [Dermatophilaceae bacterium]
RRTRISIETPSRGTDSAAAVAGLVAPILGWDEPQVANEIAAYQARVDAELESQKELVDSEANEERLAAPDVRQIPISRVHPDA